MAVANLFLPMAVYMQLFFIPEWMFKTMNCSGIEVASALGSFGLGIFVLGGFCSYLIQKYRRNIVCIRSIVVMALCLCVLYYWNIGCSSADSGFWVMLLLRFIEGAAFGLAQMILSSTLIIDKCESFQRTEANYAAAWFYRFSLALGPTLVLSSYPLLGFNFVVAVAVIMCVLSVLLILSVKFPFRAPEDKINCFSSDRFFLPQGKWLFLNFFIITITLGLTFTAKQNIVFYVMLMVGFFLALLSQRFVFVNADLKSEVTSGILLMAAAFLLMFSDESRVADYLSPVLLGCGYGIISARFLLFFIKLCQHCQRGTSQSTYFLACEAGVSVGVFIGYGFVYQNEFMMKIISLSFLCAALILYLAFVHKWYILNKNR